MMDLYLDNTPALPTPRPLVRMQAEQTCLSALCDLSKSEDPLGHVVDNHGKTVGFVTARELRKALLRAE